MIPDDIAVFSYFYVTTGVFQEQPHEMIVFSITNITVLCYVIINFISHVRRNPGHDSDFVLKLV